MCGFSVILHSEILEHVTLLGTSQQGVQPFCKLNGERMLPDDFSTLFDKRQHHLGIGYCSVRQRCQHQHGGEVIAVLEDVILGELKGFIFVASLLSLPYLSRGSKQRIVQRSAFHVARHPVVLRNNDVSWFKEKGDALCTNAARNLHLQQQGCNLGLINLASDGDLIALQGNLLRNRLPTAEYSQIATIDADTFLAHLFYHRRHIATYRVIVLLCPALHCDEGKHHS